MMRDIDPSANTILNVDDYAPARYARTKILSTAGFNVIQAQSGAEALQLVTEIKPHLIILDIHLPDISGLEVCKQLKADRATAGIVVLHISATAVEPSDVIDGLQQGADSYLIEPVDPGVLVATVKALLRAREAEEALCILTAQENERRLIALELHDDLAQRLGFLAMEFNDLKRRTWDSIGAMMDRLEPLLRQVESLSEDVRRISHQLHPSVVEDLGLEGALRQLVNDFQRVQNMRTCLVIQAVLVPIPLGTATALYRIAQEALNNCAKHAPSALVHVSLWMVKDQLQLAIKDNGPGFDITTVHKKDGLGLIGMRERARLAGGKLSLHSVPGAGTEVVVGITLSARHGANLKGVSSRKPHAQGVSND